MSGDAPNSHRLFFREAIAHALANVMHDNPRVILLGQDIGAFGGSYKEFKGLHERFPEQVLDTPIAENAMIGMAVGAAAAGLRPLVSITYMDFLMLGLDPLVNYGVKARFKTGGQLAVPLIVKTTAGAKGQGVAHSQCLEAWMASVPGLRIFAPSNPADAYLLLKAAFACEGPVLFIDHKRLFPMAGDVPLGTSDTDPMRAKLLRTGCDLTITSHSYMTTIALAAATQLAEEGIEATVIDLRSLAPIDITTIRESVMQTGALLTLEEGQATCGIGSEIITRLHVDHIPFKAGRIAALAMPVSSNPVLEAACLPDADRVVKEAQRLYASKQRET